MKKEKGKLTALWEKAKSIIDNYSPSQAEELSEILEWGILYLAKANLEEGITDDKALIENVKKEVWHSRFWVAMENYVWPTYPDYEENWKFS